MFRADYSLPCSEVFARATFNTLQGFSPRFACFFLNAHIAVSTYIDGLPTWAIDFSNLQITRGSNYAARLSPLFDHGCQPSVSVDPGWKVLSISAFTIGFVESSFSMEFCEAKDLDQGRRTPSNFADKIAGAIAQFHNAKDELWHGDLTRLDCIKQSILGERSQQPCKSIDQVLGPSTNDDLNSTLHEHSSHKLTPQDFVADQALPLWRYCNYADDVARGCKYFVTSSKHIGLGLTLLERGDKLIYPTFDCKHNLDGKIAIHDFWYQPVIALRPQGDQWVFRGAVYLNGLERMDLDSSRVERFDIC